MNASSKYVYGFIFHLFKGGAKHTFGFPPFQRWSQTHFQVSTFEKVEPNTLSGFHL